MRKPLFALLLMILGFFLPSTKALAYGPFVLPIHDNSVEINGGAWNYSVSCSAAQYEVDYYPLLASHGGYDFDGDEGDNVYAAASGVVADIQNSDCPNTYPNGNPTWGCFVDIKHDVDGDSIYDYTTKYTHLVSGSITVAVGNSVSSNTLIGHLGNSGFSDGAHLHFGVQNYDWAQYLNHDYWLDPYNLNDDNATCCDIPNGCPNEGTASQHSDFDCDAATDSDYLWASCPPTYDAEVNSCTTSAYDVTLAYITDAFTSTGTDGSIVTYYQDGDNELNLYGDEAVVTDTANPNYTLAWLSGRLTNDDETDLVQVTATTDHTHAYVYRSAGSGGFYALEEWKSTGTPADYAFLDDVDNDSNDLADLILGYLQSDSTVQWKICSNLGTIFDSCAIWTTTDTTDTNTFGSDGDVFIVGNFDGSGGADILRGRTQSTSSCNGKLKWKLLTSSGNDTSVKDCWGYPSDQYLSGNANGTGGDDLIRIHTATTDPEDVFASVGVMTSGALSTSSWSDDVGGTTATYSLGDVNQDGYDDILRWGTNNLQWLENNHTSFEQQGGADDLITNFPQSADDAILYGTFGSVDECITIESTTTPTTTTTVNPYTSQVLTNLASADLADLSSSVTCAVDEADSLYVVLNGQDGRIYEFESTDDGVTWTSTPLTNIAAVPLSAPGTTPHLFIDPDTGDRYVTFMGVNARVNLFHYDGTSWTAVELTSVVAAPLGDITSSPYGYIANGVIYVVFQGNDQRIWRFSVNGGSYGSLDVTGQAAVALAMPGTSPSAVYNEITGEHHIVFQGVNQRIQRLTFNGSTWSSVEITSVVNSDLLDQSSSPMTYVDPFTGYVYTVINGVNERIDLIADYHTSWDSDELTSLISVPLTEPGSSPTGYIDPFTGNHVITLQGDNGRINQFEGPDMTAPTDWTSIDQTSQAAVEFAASGTSPATCVDPFTGVRHTVFVGENGRVQYLRYGP